MATEKDWGFIARVLTGRPLHVVRVLINSCHSHPPTCLKTIQARGAVARIALPSSALIKLRIDWDYIASLSLATKGWGCGEKGKMNRLANESEMKWMPLLYGVTAGLSSLVVVLMLVWTFHFRGGFAWQDFPSIQFNWHPVLMVVSFIVLYGHGILVYRLLRNEPKKKLKWLHAVMMMTALLLASVGLKAVFDSHNLAEPPIDNLYTLHSWIGLSAVICFALQWLFGFVSFLFPGVRHSLRASYMPLHVYGGLMIFGLATAAALMGLLEKAIFSRVSYAPLTAEGILINCTGVAVASLSLLILYIATRWQYKRQPLPEDELLLADQLAE